MHSRRIILATAIAVLLSHVPATFAETKPVAAPSQFKKIYDKVELKDGDTFVFLGDSITHQCLYTQYVEDYFYTRMPKVRIHFHNAGVGSTARRMHSTGSRTTWRLSSRSM